MERRAQILEHALALFAKHGFDRTSVRMIAQHAGVAQGLLYNYFASKHELLEAIFLQSMQDVNESFARADACPDPLERIERLLRAVIAIVQQNRAFWKLSYSLRMQPDAFEELRGPIQTWVATIQQTLEGYLRSAAIPDPATEAAILFALIDGVAQHYVMNPDQYPIEAVIQTIAARYRQLSTSADRTMT